MFVAQSILLLAVAAQLAASALVANLNITEATAAEYGCGPTCYERFSAGLAADAAYIGDGYDEAFYSTAANYSNSNPGDLLKFGPINATRLGSEVPAGTTVYRFQYVSVDLSGAKVPATGFIAVPYASRNNDHKYPLVAYAHGTSGVFRGCAPSATAGLFDYRSWTLLVERGYAVVATDYVGLGSYAIRHQYVASPAQANDLFYSVMAARVALRGVFTEEWMSVGHSQGGGAVWALAESHLLQNGSGDAAGRYIGTVAQAPATRIKEMALLFAASTIGGSNSSGEQEGGAASSDGILGEVAWVVFGLRSIAPGTAENWLRPTFRKRLELAELTQACFESIISLVADLAVDEVLDFMDPELLDALDIMHNVTARGEASSDQPILVVQGTEDVAVLPQAVESSYSAACGMGNEIHLQLYPGLGHQAVIRASAPFFLQWMDDRFAGRNTSGTCSNSSIVPFDAGSMYTG